MAAGLVRPALALGLGLPALLRALALGDVKVIDADGNVLR